jgi:hypothetical protein
MHYAAIANIFARMQGGITSFFWDRGADNPITYPQFMSACDQASGNGAFALVMNREIIGFVLLSDFCKKHRAHISMWLEPKVRGVNSHLIAQQTLMQIHHTHKIQNLYALTPWRHSQELCLRAGMIEVAEVPSYCKWGDRIHDLKVFHSDPSLWRQEEDE